MAMSRVYADNLPAESLRQLSRICADYRQQMVSQPPADAALVGSATVDVLAGVPAQLEARTGLQHIPIVVAGGPDSADAWQAAAGTVQGYVPGYAPHRIAAQVRMVCDTVRAFAAVHPLTGLPGSPALQREIETRLSSRGSLAVVQFDLDNFKPYNDIYGYQRGDEMLLWLKGLIHGVIAECRPAHCFLAHLGGDDFILTADVSSARMIARQSVDRFEAQKQRFFTDEHRHEGKFVAVGRSGTRRDVPLTTLTAVMVTNEAADITHPGHVSAVLAEMKSYAKSLCGSNFVADRRSEHWTSIPQGSSRLCGQKEGQCQGGQG